MFNKNEPPQQFPKETNFVETSRDTVHTIPPSLYRLVLELVWQVKMTSYRRYKASYDFQARDSTEISMTAGDTLRVALKPSGDWPDPQKFMRGVNERTGAEGDFPGGQYVEFVEEFAEPDQDALYDEPPPPTPPRRGTSAVKVNEPEPDPGMPQAPPRPKPRNRSVSTLKGQEEAQSPTHSVSPPPDRVHRWTEVTFQIPMLCAACECVWGVCVCVCPCVCICMYGCIPPRL